jgi:type I restriction-modification system DNA methylase subunit
MSDTSNRIVQKLWSYCNVLRDDGLSYQDYLEQLTFLLFLKMADERHKLTGGKQPIPKGYRWEDLANPDKEGVKLEQHYRETLAKLGSMGGMLGLIFEKAQNKIQDPAKLRQLIVELIGKEDWLSMSADVKGDAYEGLLERNAQDVKGGAGQYFTPRVLIEAIVDCVQPQPGETVDRSRVRHRRLPARHAWLHRAGVRREAGPLAEEALASGRAARRRTGARRRAPVRHEPVPAWRRPRRRRVRPARAHG